MKNSTRRLTVDWQKRKVHSADSTRESEDQHQDQCVPSRCSHHPAVRLRVMGHLPTPRAISPVLLSHHPQHPLEQLSSQRDAWRQTVHQAVSTLWRHLQDRPCSQRERRKTRDTAEPPPDQSFPWSHCGQACLSRIGLVSHQRACSRCGQHPP